MPNYRRWYVQGGTVYFTLVTYRRRRLFADAEARRILGNVMRDVCRHQPFETVACVLLWDHLHTIWKLPEGDADYSTRWHAIKSAFTMQWLKHGGTEDNVSDSQAKRGHRGVWQRRFWEHQVHDADELEALCDYIHYNPVKHGYVLNAGDWPHSTIHNWIAKAWCPSRWGQAEPFMYRRIKSENIFGEQ